MAFQTTSPTLLRAARDPADVEAWRRFEAAYRPAILRVGRGLGLRLEDAEDAAQEVLLGLSRALPGFRYEPARGRFRSYVGRAVRRAVGARLRARGPYAAVPAIDVADDAADRAEAAWELEWRRHHCRLALATVRPDLAPSEREVLDDLLRGTSAADSARRHGLAPEAVRQARRRLRIRLRGTIERQLAREERFGVA